MSDDEDFSALESRVFASVVSTVRAVTALGAHDIPFQRSSDADFAGAADDTAARILALANALLAGAAPARIAPLGSEDDIEQRWGDVVDVTDHLLERADVCLDEASGAIKPPPVRPLPAAAASKPRAAAFRTSVNSWATRNMAKPQLAFAIKPDNVTASDEPFRPLLTVKPHASVPLAESLHAVPNEAGRPQYIHPYAAEIASLQYPERLFVQQPPQASQAFDDTEAVFVDSPQLLLQMLEELKQAPEIAVDLEHHDQRSYVGFVCLMQISTRDRDWIVDTLKLRGELQILNQVFADPNIIKVLHGASMDIVWLQRDFGLYIVGLFDTYWAARTLGFKGHGLAFLLKKYVDFDADKQYQLADWRIRPLPEEMFNYARSDTHFLLYCFDMLRNELLQKTATAAAAAATATDDPESKMATVLARSKEVSLRRYEKEAYDAEGGEGALGWRTVLGRSLASASSSHDALNPMELAVFKAVHRWRDTTARVEDESVNYVMSRHQLFNLARHAPTDIAGVLACCSRPSPPVKLRAGDLVVAIRTAMDSPEVREWRSSPWPGSHTAGGGGGATATAAAAAGPTATAATAAGATATATTAATTTTAAAAATHVTATAAPRIDVFASQNNALRAKKSSFWGDGAAESSLWQECAAVIEMRQQMVELRLAVPLPPLTAAVFVDPSDSRPRIPSKPADPGARVAHEFVRKERRDGPDGSEDVVVMRSLGGGRKRKLAGAADRDGGREEGGVVAGSDDLDSSGGAPLSPQQADAGNDKGKKKEKKEKREKKEREGEKWEKWEGGEEGGEKREKREKRGRKEKREKKRKEKREKREQQKGVKEADDGPGDDDGAGKDAAAPFDYAAAPSVLNPAAREPQADGKTKKKQKKTGFDPYAQSASAPRGLARANLERAGRTGTFKE